MRQLKIFKSKKAEATNSGQGSDETKQVSENKNETMANEKCEEENEEKQTPKNDMNSKKRVFNLIILDESGSMASIYEEALSGVNETLQTIRSAKKDHPEQEHFVTLVAFDSSHYNQIYKVTPADQALDITTDQYRPFACTPLFDAMGKAITDLNSHLDKIGTSEEDVENVVLVTIITDGYENASKEFTGSAIKALVEKMSEKGWVFTYIGANQDVFKVAESLAIKNFMAFVANAEGTKDMFMKERRARSKFLNKLHIAKEEREKDYFED